MRLTAAEREAIRDAVHAVAGPGARARLFGSRVDDAKRGGDSDIFVELEHPADRPAVLSANISVRIQQAIGEQRVNVLVAAPNIAERPIHRIARATSVAL